ncbi:hypothetical protein HOY80DRAFT_1102329 [Tuber brumale]|nr:hypothetical protein HOY80DRAFT_1102329 [Tuber brumale]
MEKDKVQPRKLYDLIIATSRILLIGKSFFRRQTIDQLRSHLSLDGRVLSIIVIGMPMGFEAVAYARSTILEDCIQDVGKAFQSLLTKNAGGFAKTPIEKEPGATIAPCTNRGQCPCSPLALQTAPTAKTTAASRSVLSAPAICRDSWMSHPKKKRP